MPTRVLRHLNATKVFHAVRRNAGVTQRGIMELVDAEKSTVSAILRDFEDAGMVLRSEKPHGGGRGRPSEGYSIAPAAGAVMGVHLRPNEIRYVFADLTGEHTAVLTGPAPSVQADTGRLMAAGIRGLLLSVGQDVPHLRAIGISVPGFVDRNGHVRHSPNLQWSDFNPREQLSQELDVPIYVENDVNSHALAELHFGRGGEDRTFLYVAGMSGVGAAIVQAGTLQHGDLGFAGELGHSKIVRNGRPCRCGGNGCLSAYTSMVSLRALLAEADVPTADDAAVLRLAESGDPAARPVFLEWCRNLGQGIANLISVTGIGHVHLGSGFARLHPYFTQELHEAVLDCLHHAIRAEVRIEAAATASLERPLSGVAIALDGCTGPSAIGAAPWSRKVSAAGASPSSNSGLPAS